MFGKPRDMKCVPFGNVFECRCECGYVTTLPANNGRHYCDTKNGVLVPFQAAGNASVVNGPGTELKKLLAKIGITAGPDCKCNKRAAYMDEMEAAEPGWCEAHLDEIVGWLREAAHDRGLPFIDAAGRLLVKRAIASARRAAAS